jgi:hypothetical protein
MITNVGEKEAGQENVNKRQTKANETKRKKNMKIRKH